MSERDDSARAAAATAQRAEPTTDPVDQAVAHASTRRLHCAAVAAQVLQDAPGAAPALGWAELGAAPPWLALDRQARDVLATRVGAVLYAPALRLWISAPAVAAAREAVGDAWWQALMSHRSWPELPDEAPHSLGPVQQQLGAAALARLFREAGAAVLLSTLPHGALRHAASELLAPVGAYVMPSVQAQALLDLALSLVALPRGSRT